MLDSPSQTSSSPFSTFGFCGLSPTGHHLGLNDVQPHLLGRAYEYLLRKFAEGQGQRAGEFYTPAEVARVLPCAAARAAALLNVSELRSDPRNSPLCQRFVFRSPQGPSQSGHRFRFCRGARYELQVGESPSVDEIMDDLEVGNVLGEEGHSFHTGGGRDGEVDLAPSRVATTTGHRGGELTPDTGDLDAHRQGVERRLDHG